MNTAVTAPTSTILRETSLFKLRQSGRKYAGKHIYDVICQDDGRIVQIDEPIYAGEMEEAETDAEFNALCAPYFVAVDERIQANLEDNGVA
jgi:hypothetical protein